MHFVIRWATFGYVTKNSSNRKPYAMTAADPDTKVWKTRKAAERFLELKDPTWASQCAVEEVSP